MDGILMENPYENGGIWGENILCSETSMCASAYVKFNPTTVRVVPPQTETETCSTTNLGQTPRKVMMTNLHLITTQTSLGCLHGTGYFQAENTLQGK